MEIEFDCNRNNVDTKFESLKGVLVSIKGWVDKNGDLFHTMDEVKKQQDAVVMKLDVVVDDVKLCGRRLEIIQNSAAKADAQLKEVFDNMKKNQEYISIVITVQKKPQLK
jgi:hypothetical protein